MDDYTIKVGLAIALVVIVGLLFVVMKFFSRLFKYFVLVLIVAVIGVGIYVYRMIPRVDPNVGKHAYMKDSGKYLGVVEGAGNDTQRGEVWIVRPPGSYPVKYSKSRLRLSDRREIEKEPKEDPSPSPSQSPTPSQSKKKPKKATPEKKQ